MPIVTTVVVAGVVMAPLASADPAGNLRDAVAAGRAGTSCGPLSYNEIVEEAAEIINRSNDAYVNHTATHIPIDNASPGLKDLGYTGTKSVILQGAHRNATDAIKGALLEGHAAIPECSYTDFGVSIMRNAETDHTLAVVVLAGP